MRRQQLPKWFTNLEGSHQHKNAVLSTCPSISPSWTLMIGWPFSAKVRAAFSRAVKRSLDARSNTATHRAAPIRSIRSWTTSAQADKTSLSFGSTFKTSSCTFRYFAVRNDAGNYLGTVELTQDLTPLRQLSGERRLLAYEGS